IECTLYPVHALELTCARSRSARKLNLFLTGCDFRHVTRKRPLRAPQVNLKGERILAARIALDYPLQWRVRHEAAIPIVLAIDLDGGKPRWQCPARPDVLRRNLVSGGIEIDEVAGPHIDRTRAEPGHPRVEAIKIHQALQRVLQLF